MEQTLGKRIAEYRKQQKLTQDQLAERLGITAQAVSKWENDQSCPDIAILPQLASIFGISVDVLLGAEPIPVQASELIDQPQSADPSSKSNTRWEFHYDPGRKGGISFALWVLLVGGLLLADRILDWNVGLWSIAWPTALIMLGLFTGKGFSFFRLGLVALGSYFLLENLNVPYFSLGSKLIWPAVIILFGLALLADALRKPKKPKISVVNHDYGSKTQWQCTNEANEFTCDLSFGENTFFVTSPHLCHGSASVSFGELTVDLRNCTGLDAECEIDASCSFGELTFIVPKHYLVKSNTGTFLASFDISGEPDPTPSGIIRMNANVNFGEIRIRYV